MSRRPVRNKERGRRSIAYIILIGDIRHEVTFKTLWQSLFEWRKILTNRLKALAVNQSTVSLPTAHRPFPSRLPLPWSYESSLKPFELT